MKGSGSEERERVGVGGTILASIHGNNYSTQGAPTHDVWACSCPGLQAFLGSGLPSLHPVCRPLPVQSVLIQSIAAQAAGVHAGSLHGATGCLLSADANSMLLLADANPSFNPFWNPPLRMRIPACAQASRLFRRLSVLTVDVLSWPPPLPPQVQSDLTLCAATTS